MAEHLMGGSTVKIVQGGQAASAGIMAAGLAGKGITGCPVVLEGSDLKGGFTQITSKVEPKMERLTEKLGEHYSIMDIYFKPYTACRHTHGAAQATLALIKKHSVKPGDIESITVHTYAVAIIAVGKSVPDGGSFVSAQFSIPYVVAACVLDGDLGPSQLTERRMADPVLMELAGRVAVVSDDELNKMYPDRTASRVDIKLKNGKTTECLVEIPKGDPRDPMNADDIAEKVRRFSGSRDRGRVNAVIESIMNIEGAKSVGELAALI
jgi:2-methylcitrate dehydratase PrpD